MSDEKELLILDSFTVNDGRVVLFTSSGEIAVTIECPTDSEAKRATIPITATEAMKIAAALIDHAGKIIADRQKTTPLARQHDA